MTIHKSPYPDITALIPDVTLPIFLFAPLGLPDGLHSEAKPPSIEALQQTLCSPQPDLDNSASSHADLPAELKDVPAPPRPHAVPLSLAGLRDRAERFALGLRTGGWSSGHVLSIVSENQHDYAAAILGAHLLGVRTALHNPSYTAKELQGQFDLVKPRGVLASRKTWKKCSESCKDAFEHDRVWVFEEPEQHEDETVSRLSWFNVLNSAKITSDDVAFLWRDHERTVAAQDDAVYCFSSGTSGVPKAVRLSHGNLVANIIQATCEMRDRTHKPLLDRWPGQSSTSSTLTAEQSWYNEPRAFAETGSRGPTDDGVGILHQGGESLLKRMRSALHIGSKKRGETPMSSTSSSGPSPSPPYAPVTHDGRTEKHIDILPQFHCYGLLVSFVAMHTNTPRFILPRFSLPLFLRLVTSHKITFAFIVPPILLALSRSPMVDHPSIDISSLTRLASGAASLPTKLRQELWDKRKIKVTNGYGMSEMSPIISLQMVRDLDVHPESVGLLCPGTEARVVDVASGKDVGVEEGGSHEQQQVGELWLRGPQQMQGYLNNDEANRSAFVDADPNDDNTTGGRGGRRWLRTGDVVSIDARGYITIHDRTKDIIKVHGFQVSPSELEEACIAQPGVHDVAVVGIRDTSAKTTGEDGLQEEVPWAFCVPLQGRSAEEANENTEETSKIMAEVNQHLARYKHIRGVTWLDALPKSDAGKVLKKDLKARKK